MIEPQLWTRLWILWITRIQLVMSVTDDRPPALTDRRARTMVSRLSPGLGMVPRRPLAVRESPHTIFPTRRTTPNGGTSAREGPIWRARRCARRGRRRRPAPANG